MEFRVIEVLKRTGRRYVTPQFLAAAAEFGQLKTTPLYASAHAWTEGQHRSVKLWAERLRGNFGSKHRFAVRKLYMTEE